MPRVFASLFSILFFAGAAFGQNPAAKTSTHTFIQFSGVILDQDSLTRIPYVSVIVKGTRHGTVSDFYGFFSVVCSPGDELEFSAVTHKNRTFKIPDTTTTRYHYAIQLLTRDTIQLKELDVYPWPSKEDFRKAFLSLNLHETDAERADKNFSRNELSYLERTQATSPTESYKYVMQAYYTKVYTIGQTPQMQLLNPIAWAQFIDSWRKGKFKEKSPYKKK